MPRGAPTGRDGQDAEKPSVIPLSVAAKAAESPDHSAGARIIRGAPAGAMALLGVAASRLVLTAIAVAGAGSFAGPPALAAYIGNDLVARSESADGDPPLVIIGAYNGTQPLASVGAGLGFAVNSSVYDVKFYRVGGGAYDFTLFALTPAGSPTATTQAFTIDAPGLLQRHRK